MSDRDRVKLYSLNKKKYQNVFIIKLISIGEFFPLTIDNIGLVNYVVFFAFKNVFQVMLGAIPLVLPDIVPGLKQRKTA